MMREVLETAFKRLLKPPEGDAAASAKADDDSFPQWPDLVIIDAVAASSMRQGRFSRASG